MTCPTMRASGISEMVKTCPVELTSEISNGISGLRKPTFRAINRLGRLDLTSKTSNGTLGKPGLVANAALGRLGVGSWKLWFGCGALASNVVVRSGSTGVKVNSKRPRSSVMAARLLSGERTSARRGCDRYPPCEFGSELLPAGE